MRWSPGGKSSDIDDLRGQSAGGFGGGGLRIGGGLGIGGVILLLILSAVTGTDLTSFLGDGGRRSDRAGAVSARAVAIRQHRLRQRQS
jgi:predicted metalloprotease